VGSKFSNTHNGRMENPVIAFIGTKEVRIATWDTPKKSQNIWNEIKPSHDRGETKKHLE
jgi:hypothetical protein